MKIIQLSYPFCMTEDGRVWEYHACHRCPAGWYKADSAAQFNDITVREREAADNAATPFRGLSVGDALLG